MLTGKRINLRPVLQSDLAQAYAAHININNRGEFFPTGVMSERDFYKEYEENGFLGKEAGMLLIVDQEDRMVGHIEFFKTVNYLDEFELSYHIYDRENHGKGYSTEAVDLLVGYLFGRLKMNRIRLIIHPDNLASRKIAAKCGFTHEGTARGAWYHQGRNHDVEVYALLRSEYEQKRLA